MNTNAQAGGSTDLLSSIMGVTVRNEEKIAAEDREFCEGKQAQLYTTLKQLQWWYKVFTTNAEPFRERYNLHYEENGSVAGSLLRRFYHNEGRSDYSVFLFLPFDSIDAVVELYGNAVGAFACDIVRHFNEKYSVSVPPPEIDKKKLPPGTMPTYQPYVDMVIAHLGGKGFRETAEEELIARFHDRVTGYRDVLKAELKGDRIMIADAIWLDSTYDGRIRIKWDSAQDLSKLCAGIVFGTTESLNGGVNYLVGFDSENVDVSRRYGMIGGAVSVKLYKNRRVDFKFESADTAERCWKRLRLDTFKTTNGDE